MNLASAFIVAICFLAIPSMAKDKPDSAAEKAARAKRALLEREIFEQKKPVRDAASTVRASK